MTRPARYLLILITAGFVVLTFIQSFRLSGRYGGTDLRCRIVGARLLATEHSPYFYKWNSADSDFFLDPNTEPEKEINGNVVTPATLAVIYPLSQLSYSKVRLIWTVLQILAAIAIVFLLFKSNNISDTLLLASPALLGIVCSSTWLYHIERGQMYIFYALVFAVMYRLYISRLKYNQFFSGMIGGLFILFRPFAGIVGLGFVLHGKKQWLLGCLSGLALGILLFVLPQPGIWKDYFKAMPEYVKLDTGTGQLNPEAAAPEIPVVIEGTTNLRDAIPSRTGRLETTYHFFKRVGIDITVNQSLILFAIVLVVLSWLFFRLKNKGQVADTLFLFGFLLFILTELFIPAPRGEYNVVTWIFPVSLLFLRHRSNLPVLILLVLALLLLHDFPFPFPHQGELAEFLLLILTAFVIFFPDTVKKLSHGFSRTG